MPPSLDADASVSAGSPCPAEDRLRHLLEGRGDASDQASLVSHLDECAGCQHRLESLAAGSDLWSKAAKNLRESAADEYGELSSLMARLQTRMLVVEDTLAPCHSSLATRFLRPCSTPGRLGCLGPYEVVEVLGRGGMGVVYKAIDPVLERVVAIKVLACPPAFSAEGRARFRREARAAAAVHSEHAVVIHAVEETAEPPYLVMEYIEGTSLQERLDRKGPLEIDDILRIGSQIARGLAAAHAQGLIHRDIKPANILLEAGTGKVKITDFGLARAVDAPSLTQAGTVTGTPEYMAPEQASDGPIDHRADLFSLGSVLYAMCTGRPPFRAERSLAVLRRTREDAPVPIRQLRPDVPDALIAIIEKLHHKTPQERFATAVEAAEALEDLGNKWALGLRSPNMTPLARFGRGAGGEGTSVALGPLGERSGLTITEDNSMASRWFYRVFDQEMGPVGFDDLAEMIRVGTLTEDDRVRRELSEEWTPAREVIGLLRAARGPAAEASPPEAEIASPEPEPKTPLPEPRNAGIAPALSRRRWRFPHLGAGVWIGAAIGLACAAIVGYEFWSHRQSRIFPESALNRPRSVDRKALESMRAPRPSVPSVPGLKEGMATLVPGLEEIDRIHSACLTPDLRTIVFAAKSRPGGGGYHLFIATRDDVSAPFGKPKRIDACSTPNPGVYPTLSPDGLELMYMQWEKRQYLFRAVRESTSSEFANPKAWLIPGVDPEKERVAGPRFLDPLHVFFLIVGPNFNPRAFFIAERTRPKSDFGPPRPVKTSGWIHSLVFVMPDSQRAYFPTGDGLHVIVRPNKDVLGGEDVLVAPTKATGTIDGRIWVAPQEDVVFYISTGPGKEPNVWPHDEGNKLWMFRF